MAILSGSRERSTSARFRARFTVVSIYATLWKLRFPKDGDLTTTCEWIEVTAQGVPPHIGSPSVGAGYETGDPFSAFLPSPVAVGESGNATHLRAVVFVTGHTANGTARSQQEYASPLLVLSGAEYARIGFDDLHERLCAALRGNRAPVVAEIVRPDGSTVLVRDRGTEDPGSNRR